MFRLLPACDVIACDIIRLPRPFHVATTTTTHSAFGCQPCWDHRHVASYGRGAAPRHGQWRRGQQHDLDPHPAGGAT